MLSVGVSKYIPLVWVPCVNFAAISIKYFVSYVSDILVPLSWWGWGKEGKISESLFLVMQNNIASAFPDWFPKEKILSRRVITLPQNFNNFLSYFYPWLFFLINSVKKNMSMILPQDFKNYVRSFYVHVLRLVISLVSLFYFWPWQYLLERYPALITLNTFYQI